MVKDNVMRCLSSKAFSWAFPIVVIVAVFTAAQLSTVVNEVDDDYGIALALSGLYPESGYSLFVNALISDISLALSTAFPGVNGFYALETAVVAVSIFLLCHSSLRLMSDRFMALGLMGLIVFLLVPMCTFLNNFTCVAALATLSGFFVLVLQVRAEKAAIPLTIVAIALCVFGFMIRKTAFIMGLPFVAIAVLWHIARFATTAEGGTISRHIAIRCIPLIAVAALCATVTVYDSAVWDGSTWGEWRSYNEYHSLINDYPMPDYRQVDGNLEAMGVSELDYQFARSWRYADRDFFTTDRLADIASLRFAADAPTVKSVIVQLKNLLLNEITVLMIAAIVLMLYVVRHKKASLIDRVAFFAIGVLSVAVISYFVYVGRIPNRVLYCIVAYGAVFAVAGLDCATISWDGMQSSSEVNRNRVYSALLAAVCVIGVVAMMAQASPALPAVHEEGAGDERPGTLSEYIHQHGESLVVADVETLYDYMREYRFREFPGKEELVRVFGLGGWSIESPYIKARNESLGMPNVMKGLVENGHALQIIRADKDTQIGEMVRYLENHYYEHVNVELVDSLETAEGQHYFVYDYSK